jgi:hypothetical protein
MLDPGYLVPGCTVVLSNLCFDDDLWIEPRKSMLAIKGISKRVSILMLGRFVQIAYPFGR